MSHSEFLFAPADLPPAVKHEKLFENLLNLKEYMPKTGRRPISRNSLLKALIYKSLRRFPFMSDLTFELNNNPSVSKALGFNPLAPALSIERFLSFLHDTKNYWLKVKIFICNIVTNITIVFLMDVYINATYKGIFFIFPIGSILVGLKLH